MFKAEAVKIKERIFYFAKNYSLRFIFVRFMCFIAGIIISRGNILGAYYPFGMSLSAAVPGKFIAPAVIGTVAGYLFPLNLSSGIRYISTVISITAVRWTLSDLTKIKNHFLYVPAVVFCSSLITGFAVSSAEGVSLREISLNVLESLIAAGAAYFFKNSFNVLSRKKIYNLSTREFTFVILSLNIVLLSVSGFSTFGISIGRILALLIILISAHVLGIQGGALAGISSGAVFSLPAFGLSNISVSYAFGGMISGLFSHFGKLGISFAFIFSWLITAFQSGDSSRLIYGIYEVLIAIFIYLAIPGSFLSKFKKSGFDFWGVKNKSDLKRVFAQKLHFASKSVSSVPAYIEKAFWDVFKFENKSFSFKSDCVASIYSACKHCKKAPLCWGENAKNTSDFFGRMIDKINLGKDFGITPALFEFCENKNKIINSIKESYSKFDRQNSAKNRLCELKRSISEQMSGISSVMEDFSQVSNQKLTVKEDLLDSLKNELLKKHIPVLNLICYQNENQKLFIDIECDSIFANKFDEEIVNLLSKACGRKLSMPVTNNYGMTSRIQICEAKKFSVDFGFSQHAFGGGAICGDSFCKFEDGEGNLNVIISDGMGTGDAAALQGNITAELMKNFVKSGIGATPAVKFVNSALLADGSDETLSTLDMVSINLFDGNAKFIKAGSPPTFIIRGGEIIKISAESLPIGILSEASISFKEFNLQKDDFVLMFSDGVTDIGEEFVSDIIKSQKYESAKMLSNIIVKKSVSVRKKNCHDDDITCIAMKIVS